MTSKLQTRTVKFGVKNQKSHRSRVILKFGIPTPQLVQIKKPIRHLLFTFSSCSDLRPGSSLGQFCFLKMSLLCRGIFLKKTYYLMNFGTYNTRLFFTFCRIYLFFNKKTTEIKNCISNMPYMECFFLIDCNTFKLLIFW